MNDDGVFILLTEVQKLTVKLLIMENEQSELALMNSNFFGKLGYLLDRDLITKAEIKYFEYYIKKAIENKAVMRYARMYDFENFALLLNTIDNFSYYLYYLPEKDLPKEQKKIISNWVSNQGRSVTGNLTQ